jgi:hypothetical protein
MIKNPQLNALVVFNHQPDATLFRIKTIAGYRIGVIDISLEDSVPNQAMQWVDRSMLLMPSIGQLRHGGVL